MKKIICLLLSLAFIRSAGAQTFAGEKIDTIGAGHLTLSTAWLQPGMHQYLIYMQDSSRKRTLFFWYWLRDIEKLVVDGESCFRTTQHWYGQDTTSYRESFSINKAADFSPLYYKALKGGKVYAYRWRDREIMGDDTVAGNVAKDFSLAFQTPSWNWELDMETFEMLPLAAGRAFAISFYDAGLDPPQYVVYRVVGSETLTMLDGARADCWKLYTEGKSPRGAYSETYWISKKGHRFLKEEDHFGSTFRLKMLMPGNTPDPLNNFR